MINVNNFNASLVFKTISLGLIVLVSFYPIIDDRVGEKQFDQDVVGLWVSEYDFVFYSSTLEGSSAYDSFAYSKQLDNYFVSTANSSSSVFSINCSSFIESTFGFLKTPKVGLYILYSTLKISPFII